MSDTDLKPVVDLIVRDWKKKLIDSSVSWRIQDLTILLLKYIPDITIRIDKKMKWAKNRILKAWRINENGVGVELDNKEVKKLNKKSNKAGYSFFSPFSTITIFRNQGDTGEVYSAWDDPERSAFTIQNQEAYYFIDHIE